MKNSIQEYQQLTSRLLITIAIVIAASILASAFTNGIANLTGAISNLATLIRDGLLQIGSATNPNFSQKNGGCQAGQPPFF